MFSRVSSGQRHRSYCRQSSWTIRWNHHRYLGSGELDLGRNIIWQTTPWMLRLNWSRLGESPLIDLWNQSIYSSRYVKQKLWEGTIGPSHSRSKSSSSLRRLGPLQDPPLSHFNTWFTFWGQLFEAEKNLVISRCCFTKNVNQMFQNGKSKCVARSFHVVISWNGKCTSVACIACENYCFCSLNMQIRVYPSCENVIYAKSVTSAWPSTSSSRKLHCS